MVPNVSCFVECVYNLMKSSKLAEVQCEAAALLVELTTAPKVLEAIEKCYIKILSDKDIDDVLKHIILERLKTVKRKIAAMKEKKKETVKIPIIVL